MDYLIDEIYNLSVTKIVKWISMSAMVVGGVVPYIPQYKEIKRTEDAEGFSLFVCLTLLVANTLRILFWFGRPFEVPLLVQSVLMNITMFFMIHLCVKMKNKNLIIKGKERVFAGTDRNDHKPAERTSAFTSSKPLPTVHTFFDLDVQYFWAWTDFVSYVDFMIIFSIVCTFFMYMFIEVTFFVETVGFLAVFFEALLGVPQLLCNYRNKSTVGMSVRMVCMWTVGDIFKTVYFIMRTAPAQFWLCGMLQISIDLFIVMQVYWYRNSVSKRSKKQDITD